MSGASQQKSAALKIKGSPPSAKRFNKRVLGTLLGGSVLAILLAAGFALRSPESKAAAPQELYNTTSKALPDSLNALPESYSEVAPRPQFGILGPPLPGDIGAGLYGKPKDIPTDNPFRYQPPSSYTPAPTHHYGGTAHQTSPNAPTGRTSNLFFIANDGGGDSANTSQSTKPAFADPGVAALAALFGQGGSSIIPQPVSGGEVSQTTNDGNNQFSSDLKDSEIYNPHSLRTPVSPYQVMAGTIIPPSLVTGLNSDLPGQVIAQITENVYDTPTGQYLLLPQGTRLLGRYDSDIDDGQSRALIVWNRLIRPDGSSLVIENLPGVDLSGQAGLRDKIDQHTGSLFKAAILSSVLSIATEFSTNKEDELAEAIRTGGQDTINQAGQRVVTRALSRKPTLSVRPGWRLGVIVNRDLVLSPYKFNGEF
jgi:type IV secretion system protein VirB10